MSYHTPENKYKGLEPEYMLLLAMIELAQRDVRRVNLFSDDARLFLVWCDGELRAFLEDAQVFEDIAKGKR